MKIYMTLLRIELTAGIEMKFAKKAVVGLQWRYL